MTAQKLLDRLESVKQTGPDRWLARCPAHQDRSPSLSIRELGDGRVLVYCFAGCEASDVLTAVGLDLGDLFPERLPEHSYRPSHSSIPAGDLLSMLDHELTVIVLILSEIVEKRSANPSQVDRLIQAASRVGKARAMANPAKVNRNAA
jgi:hypothetical protein